MATFLGSEAPMKGDNKNPIGEGKSDLEKREKQKEVEAIAYQDMRLHELAKSDDMYHAMENFLLGDPRRQVEELGSEADLIAKGNEDKSKKHFLLARGNYETAARIALFRQNKERTINSIQLARSVTDNSDNHHTLQDTILNNLDEAMRVAGEYYSTTIPAADQI
jgi:hypothetical protein